MHAVLPQNTLAIYGTAQQKTLNDLNAEQIQYLGSDRIRQLQAAQANMAAYSAAAGETEADDDGAFWSSVARVTRVLLTLCFIHRGNPRAGRR